MKPAASKHEKAKALTAEILRLMLAELPKKIDSEIQKGARRTLQVSLILAVSSVAWACNKTDEGPLVTPGTSGPVVATADSIRIPAACGSHSAGMRLEAVSADIIRFRR